MSGGPGAAQVRCTHDGAILIVRLNRPSRHNAMNAQMAAEFSCALDGLGAARVVIVAGEGASFCSGADLDELRASREALPGTAAPNMGPGWQRALDRLRTLPLPVIAAIEGYCLGGGLVLALACDIRIAGCGARFGMPEIRHGMVPGFGATQRLPRMVGAGRGKHLLFTGEPIDAVRAEVWGLLNEVTEPGQALARAIEYARTLCEREPAALANMKRLIDDGLDRSLSDAIALETAWVPLGNGGDDAAGDT